MINNNELNQQILKELEDINIYIDCINSKMNKVKRLLEDNTKENLTQYISIIDTYINKPLDKEAQSELWINTDKIKTSYLLRSLGYKADYKKDKDADWTTLTITKEDHI